MLESVAESLRQKLKSKKFAQKKLPKVMQNLFALKWKMEKQNSKVFVVMLRDNETQNAEAITAVCSNG